MTSAAGGEAVDDVVAAALLGLNDVDHLDLATLTREELLSLEDRPAFADTEDLAWWGALAEDVRTEIAASAQRGLLARQLIGASEQPGLVLVHPRVRLLLAIRSLPAFVTLQGDAGIASPATRAYGVLNEHNELAALLLERRILEGVNDFVLATPAYAAMAMTRFLFEPPRPDDPGAVAVASPVQRVVRRRWESLLPGQTSGRRRVAYAGVTAGALAPVENGVEGTPEPVTEADVLGLLLQEWAALARETANSTAGSSSP